MNYQVEINYTSVIPKWKLHLKKLWYLTSNLKIISKVKDR